MLSLVAAVLPDCVSSGPSVFFFFAVGLVNRQTGMLLTGMFARPVPLHR